MSLPTQKIKLPGIKYVLAICGSKGGVGKSFLATNLACLMAKFGKQVGLFDADITCPSIFSLMGMNAKITPTEDSKLFPVEKFAVKIMSMAALCASDNEAIAYRGTILTKVLQQLLKETLWGELDLLIIDFPSGTGDIPLTILQQFHVDSMLFISTPDKPATLSLRRSLTMARMLQIPILGILENMRGDVFGEGGVSEIAKTLDLPFLGSIPMRKQIIAYANQGVPAVFHMEELEIILSKIARTIMEKVMV